MKRGLFSFVMMMMTAGVPAVPAQRGPDPAALSALRQRYQSLLTDAAAPARARWLVALEGQEKQRVAAGDFEGAAQFRERRLGLGSGKPGAVRVPVLLLPGRVRTATGVDFPDVKKDVGRFRRTGALMEWELPGQVPGMYQVNLVCGVTGLADQNDLPDPYQNPAVALPVRAAGAVADTAAGGVVEFRKITGLRENGVVLRRSVRSTGGWTMERTLPLGQVELDSRIVKFSLRAVDALPAGLMDFRRIELVPVAASAAAADAGGLRELGRLREVYQKQYGEQTRGLTAKYLKGLGEMEVLAARDRDVETLALVRREKQRMGHGEALSTAPANGPVARVLPVTEKLYMLVKGEARLTSQGDYLTRLRPAFACEITWKLSGLGVASGTYEVEVECRLTPEHGGTAVLTATTPGGSPGPAMELKVEAPDFIPGLVVTKRKPDGTPGTSKVRTFTAGLLTIPRGSQFLKLQVTSLLVPDGALCDLKSLRLTPVAAASP